MTPTRPPVTDPYDGAPVQVQPPASITPGPDTDPYADDSRRVYRGLPWAKLTVDADGYVVSASLKRAADVTDAEKEDRSRAIRQRTARRDRAGATNLPEDPTP